jgi:hypothetical protein
MRLEEIDSGGYTLAFTLAAVDNDDVAIAGTTKEVGNIGTPKDE